VYLIATDDSAGVRYLLVVNRASWPSRQYGIIRVSATAAKTRLSCGTCQGRSCAHKGAAISWLALHQGELTFVVFFLKKNSLYFFKKIDM
jgi:hypothetical protein